MKFTSDERRSLLGVFAAGQLAFCVLLLAPLALERVLIPSLIRLGISTNWAYDLCLALIDVQQWLTWSIGLDPRIGLVVALLAQLFLAVALAFFAPLRLWIRAALIALALAMAHTLATVSAHPLLNDRWLDPFLFSVAFVSPLVGDALLARRKLAAISHQRQSPEWSFGLRTLLLLMLGAAVVLAFARAANVPASPLWFDAISNGLVWGMGAWLITRLLWSQLPMWCVALLIPLAIATSLCLLLYNTIAHPPSLAIFGTRWLMLHAGSTHRLANGVARLMGWNLLGIGISVGFIRLCGYRLVAPSLAKANSTVATPMATLESASS